MPWLFHHKRETSYWIKAFALYALVEACIQLLFFFILNNFGTRLISLIEFHLVMWVFQCLLIFPIWWVAWKIKQQKLLIQVVVNIAFYLLYSYVWFGPVQQAINFFYTHLQQITRPEAHRLKALLDSGSNASYINYQLLKHAFRLSWFYLAGYFYNYRQEEKKRLELAIANEELQLKLLKWHLNPSFYFKTINHLYMVAAEKPINTTSSILQLAKVMEYVIYEAKEKLIYVKKEIRFLNNYIELVNQQTDSRVKFELSVTGEHTKLKIAPLILAGLIDKLTAGNDDKVENVYKVHLQFSGEEMQLIVNTRFGRHGTGFLPGDDDLQKRLKELYAERFSYYYTAESNQLKLCLLLDEER
ncbi:MAG: histidine kinase [Ferruginibacter sp.]